MTNSSIKKLALASASFIPLSIGLAAAPAHAQIVNTATVTGTPDSGTLDDVEATESVTVALPIDAVNDSETTTEGEDGVTDILNVLDDDTLNSLGVSTTEVTITQVTDPADFPDELTFNPATGQVDLNPDTPAGTYSFDYQICETANPNNCDTATATITVDPSPIEAVNDTVTGINGATGAADVLNVLTGDSVSGDDADTTNVIISLPPFDADGTTANTLPPELTFDTSDGSVGVVAGTPAGTYTFTYQICEELNPDNCTTAIASVTVDPSDVVAEDDSTTVPAADATAGIDDVLNVLTDDTVNGAGATPTNSVLSVPAFLADGTTPNSVPSELDFNPADGTIDVEPGTLAGTYSFDYQICEALNPDNCETATATVTVAAAPSLEMVKEAVGDPEFVTVGQVINYTYTVTNNGNVIIRGVSVSDTHNAAGAAPTPTNPQLITDNNATGDSTDGDSGDDDWDVLAPGDVIRFTGSYTVQQADIDNLQP